MEGKESYIWSIHEDVSGWLRYAEAKNGAILAVCTAALLGVLRVSELFDSNSFLNVYYFNITGMLGLAILLAALSFFPRHKGELFSKLDRPSSDDNLMYFEDIAKYQPAEYSDKLNSLNEVEPSAVDTMVIGNIVNNAKITHYKMRLFSASLILLLSALVTPFFALGLYLYTRKKSA